VTQELWDREAESFDDEPDHGLADPLTRAAWRDLLLGVLAPPPARIADLGCGTGTLARLLSDEGYTVDGLDFSPAMIQRARAKLPEGRFAIGDAADPALEAFAYDVVLSRHVLWAMPDPEAAIGRWVRLLAPGGTLVLVEGNWATGAGLPADECLRIVRTVRAEAEVRPLPDPVLWGKEISDERYLLVSLA
jgi:SAM-dependent methyltransferase